MKTLEKQSGLASCINSKITKKTVWATLSQEDVELFNRHIVCREYIPGEALFVEGDSCKGLYFVEDGLVGVRKVDPEGQLYLIRLAGKGDTLGYRPFLAKEPHRASAAVIEEARVCFINASTVRQVLQENHKLGQQFLERTAQALGEADESLFKMAVLNVDTRLIHLLLLHHDQWGNHFEDGSVAIELPVTRGDLASMIGAHPDSVSRAIRKLESEGTIRVDGRSIFIEEIDRLADQLHTNLVHVH